MRSLRPRTIPGTPGKVAPIAFSPGACRWAKYHTPGAVRPRCGSLARSGLPLDVRSPLTTQQLAAPVCAQVPRHHLCPCSRVHRAPALRHEVENPELDRKHRLRIEEGIDA